MYSECPERKNGSNNKFGKGKMNARVYAMQHEEAPIVDSLAGTLLIASHSAYVLVDTSAIHSCISEEFMNACELHAEVIPNLAMCINTPLDSSSMITKIVKSVDDVIEGIHMPIDMLVLPMSDFDVILGMNWLNHYGVLLGSNIEL